MYRKSMCVVRRSFPIGTRVVGLLSFCYRCDFLVLVSMARWKDIGFYLVLSGLIYIVHGINREYRIYTDCRRRELTSEGLEFIANCHDM